MGTHNGDHERELQDLDRRLDAAFSTTRPRRGFEDELWEHIRARRLRGGLLERLRSAALPLATTGAALVLLAGLVTWVVNHHAPISGSTSTSAPANGSAANGQAGLRFGTVPRPPSGPAQSNLAPGSSFAQGGERAPSPAIPPTLPVYRYSAPAGPPPGTVLSVPPPAPAGAEAAPYPTQAPSQAIGEWQTAGRAAAGQSAPRPAALTQVELVYVAVNDGQYGYLVPAYRVTGTMTADGSSTQVSALLPALATSALR